MISLLLYASSSNAGSLVIFNNCEYCSSIKVIVTVPATPEDPSYDVEQTLGDNGDSVAVDVPHSGTYWVKANCLSGESYSWDFSVYCGVNFTTEEFLDCAAPTTSSTSTPVLTSTSTSSSTTTTISEVEVKLHLMTRTLLQGCSIPIPTTTFYYYYKLAYCWCFFDNISWGDEIKWKWYQPDGELYYEPYLYIDFNGSGCAWSPICISGCYPANTPGEWHVDVYFKGIKKFTEYFTIIGSTSTTSTMRTTTTTTSIIPITSTIPIPVSTTTSSYISTTTIPSKICAIIKIYGEDSEEVALLKFIRDNILNQTTEGQEIIKLYYEWSPIVVKAMEDNEDFKEEIKEMIDRILELVNGEVE